MEKLGYLDRILDEYEKSFDIYKEYEIGDRKVSAYGYFNSHSEKYLLVREVQLWETKAFEHIFFIQSDNLDSSTLEDFLSLIPNHIEPKLVRRGEKYPEKNHMYSYVTLVILGKNIDNFKVLERVKRYKYEKSYLFSFRGYLQSRIVLIDTNNKNIYTNKSGKKLERLYRNFIK